MSMANIDYNEEPVFYCKRCLSLKIRRIGEEEEGCYCDNCGSGSEDIGQCSIQEWEQMYSNKYKESYLDN